jgi:simple sugar transport system ATP-binding protein
MSDLFLSMQGVSKRFVGVQALDSVDFEIRHGEIHCLIGENGSGKSTLIKIISGAEQPDDGATITVDGETIHDYHAIDSIRRGVAVIYQDLSLFPNLAVAENIALSKAIASGSRFVNGKAIRSIASEAMGRIGISLALDELVGELSVADQQLVAICRALTHDVKLVIMDEPTASLTRREVDSLFAVVQEMQTKGIATKNFSPTYRALEDYDVDKLYVEAESLAARGLTAEDLVTDVKVVDSPTLAGLMAEQDVVLSF